MAIGIALVGSGIFAKESHLPAIVACPDLQLLAVYSRSLETARGLARDLKDVELYSNDGGDGKGYKELLSRPDIKGVIIALPITVQPAFVIDALKAGKHVLAEKPIAPTVAEAESMIKQYNEIRASNHATWCVAENFRFLESFVYAAQKIKDLGRILGFRTRLGANVTAGSKYYETPWRKTPEYQGGFLLDGGIHFVACTRVLLGPEEPVTRVSAFTAQLREHLPPVDTVNALVSVRSGLSGTFSVSFGGGTADGQHYFVACQEGNVIIEGFPRKVVVEIDKKYDEEEEFPHEENGVKQEVKAWAKGLNDGKMDPRLSVEEALTDLEILEAMLRSGEKNAVPVDIEHSR